MTPCAGYFLPSKYLPSTQGRVHIQFVGIVSIQIYSGVCFSRLTNMGFAISAGK